MTASGDVRILTHSPPPRGSASSGRRSRIAGSFPSQRDHGEGRPLVDLSATIAGGLVGGFAGCTANLIAMRFESRGHGRNVASALISEINATCEHIRDQYLAGVATRDRALVR